MPQLEPLILKQRNKHLAVIYELDKLKLLDQQLVRHPVICEDTITQENETNVRIIERSCQFLN